MKTSIELSGMRFYAYHGVFEQEQKVGNWFLVDLVLYVDISKAVHSDCLTDTINYALVYDWVAQEMQQPSLLIEHVAGCIIEHIAQECPSIQSVRVKVTKQNPPFKGQIEGVSVVVERDL